MKKINDYIKYLLTLILLEGIKVFAQTTGNLSQISSQANQELSNLYPSNSSFINTTSFSEIIKQSIDKLGYYFINYAIPFLFVFGILAYLTYESKKELNRPLLLIYLIIAFLATEFFHAVIIILALVFTLILIIVGLHKIFHGITGSIIGFLVAIAILFGVLASNSFKGFLSSTTYFIFLFVLFIIIFILSIKIGKGLPQSEKAKQLMKDIKELSYLINKPKNIRELEEYINKTIIDFNNLAQDLNNKIEYIKTDLQNLSNQQNQQNNQNIINNIKEIETSYKNLQEYYNNILSYINDIEKNISIYDEAIRPQISNFLNKKKKELVNIKNSSDIKYNSTLNSPQAKQIINLFLTSQRSRNIEEKLKNIRSRDQNMKSILEDIKKNYNDLIKEISSINPINYNTLIKSIKNAQDNAHNFLRTINNHKQKFDNEYNEILTDLKKLQPVIKKIPDQNKRSSYHKTVNETISLINNYYHDFYNYYNQYETINQLINYLQSIRNDIETIEERIKELNNYQKQFKEMKSIRKKKEVYRKFIDVFNDMNEHINSINSNISTISNLHISTKDLHDAIQNLRDKLYNFTNQLKNDIGKQYNEMEKSYDNWLSQQRINYRQQNHRHNNKGWKHKK
jgi:DNA repair ATPase RecN